MILIDVNVLVYAHRQDATDHERHAEWLTNVATGPQAFGMSDLVLSSFVRLVTNPRIFKTPSPLARALDFTDAIRRRPTCVQVEPGARHWGIFAELCRLANVKGGLVTDAYFAALAIESGSEWITTDRDYARFPGLHWRHPFDGSSAAERSARYIAAPRGSRGARRP